MGQLMNFFTPLHKRTSRKYIDRMVDDKVACMLKARGYRSTPPLIAMLYFTAGKLRLPQF